MGRRIIWRCVCSEFCDKDKCTVRAYNKPKSNCLMGLGVKAIWQRYEGRTGQRHFDGVDL